MEIFEESGHFAHEEEPERYVAVVSAFLDQVDAGIRPVGSD
jgi:pimeloyl-ACP methyl ester carboxylesterase